jgi:hypothetical protein
VIKPNGLKQTDLKILLRPNLHRLSYSQQKQFDAEPKVAQIRSFLHEYAPKNSWNTFRNEILTQFENLLAIPLRPILVRSWNQHPDIQQISLSQSRSHLKNNILPLATHTLCSQQQPNLVMQVEQGKTISLPLNIVLELSLSNVILKLDKGKVERIISGICEGSGHIQYGDTLLAQREFMGFRLTDRA